MSHFCRLTALLLLLVFAHTTPLVAQEATESLVPLRFGETVRGELTNDAPRVTYTFDMPPGQDVVVVLEADKVVLDFYCVRLTTAEGSRQECEPNQGGGSGDPPVSYTYVIPAAEDPNAAQTIDLSVVRPLDGAAQYSLVAYLMDAQPVSFGDILGNQVAAEHPYLVYTLSANPTLPFTVEIEDGDASGAFLWAAYQPYIPGFVTVSDERRFSPQWVDGASRQSSVAGIESLSLYYLGGDTFRVLVTSTGRFSLHAAAVSLQVLDEGHVLPVTPSYREPLRVLRLSTDDVSAVNIQARVVAGTGALVMAYTVDQPYGVGRSLGSAGRAGVPFPMSATIDRANTGHNGLLVVVQIPFEFTRSQVTVEISWTPG